MENAVQLNIGTLILLEKKIWLAIRTDFTAWYGWAEFWLAA